MKFLVPQGKNSTTFTPPPTDFSLLLPHIIKHHETRSRNHPLFRYLTGDSYEERTWGDAVPIFRRVARLVRGRISDPSDRERLGIVIGIVVNTDPLSYWNLLCGIILAGYVPFPISTRNSDIAIKHLLKSSNSEAVVVSDDKINVTGESALGVHRLADFVSAEADVEFPLPSLARFDPDAPAIICHSSGSTAFPKIVTLSHKVFIQYGMVPGFGEADLCGSVLSGHAMVMFHIMGAIHLVLTAVCGTIMAVPPEGDSSGIPTPDRILTVAVKSKCSMLFVVPSFLETWSQNPRDIEQLRMFDAVSFGGGPLQDHAGDTLIQHDVRLSAAYGIYVLTSVQCQDVMLKKRVED